MSALFALFLAITGQASINPVTQSPNGVINAGSIDTTKLQAGSVDTDRINTGAVDTTKLLLMGYPDTAKILCADPTSKAIGFFNIANGTCNGTNNP